MNCPECKSVVIFKDKTNEDNQSYDCPYEAYCKPNGKYSEQRTSNDPEPEVILI